MGWGGQVRLAHASSSEHRLTTYGFVYLDVAAILNEGGCRFILDKSTIGGLTLMEIPLCGVSDAARHAHPLGGHGAGRTVHIGFLDDVRMRVGCSRVLRGLQVQYGASGFANNQSQGRAGPMKVPTQPYCQLNPYEGCE